MSFTLYELTGRYRDLLELVDMDDDAERFTDTLEMLEGDINDKVENIGKLVRSIEGEVITLESEKKRIEQRISARKNNVIRLKNYLYQSLEGLNKDKIKTPLFTAWIQNNPHSVEILDEQKIPKLYLVEQAPKIDKKAIIDALKSGEQVDGASLTQTKGIRIK
jgi:seryl-tRNA synthetase